MDKMYVKWTKQLDDFDQAVSALASLERGVRVWTPIAPAIPALFDALMREVSAYGVTASDLREWMSAHEKAEEPTEFGKRALATIEAARRLKALIDAFSRERAVAESMYPEMAGGSLKQTGVSPAPGAPAWNPDAPPPSHAPGPTSRTGAAATDERAPVERPS